VNKFKFVAGEHIQSQQEIAIVGKIENWTVDQLPPRPKPPPGMLLREGSAGTCPNCGSSEDRKYWLFGPRRCINPECPLSNEWRSKIEAGRFLVKRKTNAHN